MLFDLAEKRRVASSDLASFLPLSQGHLSYAVGIVFRTPRNLAVDLPAVDSPAFFSSAVGLKMDESKRERMFSTY